jgi:transcriptional/translational regulatory protein YebC/TACO1
MGMPIYKTEYSPSYGFCSARMAPVNFMFNHVGRITVALEDPEKFLELMELAMENRAIDIVEASKLDELDVQSHWVFYLSLAFKSPTITHPPQLYCKSQDLKTLEDAIMKQENALGVKVETSEIAYVPIPSPGSEVESADSELDEGNEDKEKVQSLVQELDDLDDTLRVWSTLDPGVNL